MVSLIKGLKWQSQMLLVGLILGGGYLAYSKEWPPFTAENKTRLKNLFKPKPKTTQTPITTFDPSQNSQKYVVDPSKPLGGSQFPINVKPDENVRKIFGQELYKQLILPFDQYPHLYGNDYLNQTRDYDVLPTGTGAGWGDVLPGYRPPLKIGAGQDNAIGASAIDSSLCNSFYDTYGFYPPGGSCDPYDYFNYFDPFLYNNSYGQQSGSGSYPYFNNTPYNIGGMAKAYPAHTKDVDKSNLVDMPFFGYRKKKKLKSGVAVVDPPIESVIKERRYII